MDVLQLDLSQRPRLTDTLASATIPYSPDSLWSCDGHHIAALGPNNTATVWNYVKNTWASASIVGVEEQLVTNVRSSIPFPQEYDSMNLSTCFFFFPAKFPRYS